MYMRSKTDRNRAVEGHGGGGGGIPRASTSSLNLKLVHSGKQNPSDGRPIKICPSATRE